MTDAVFIALFLCGCLSAQSPPEEAVFIDRFGPPRPIFVGNSPPVEGPGLRIINGEASQPFTRPYMASLQVNMAPFGWFHFCGAAIVDRYKLVTAAHCLVSSPASSVRAMVGVLDLSEPPLPHTQILNVSALVPHEDFGFNQTSVVNDIGVVLLQGKISYNPNVKPAKLAVLKSRPPSDCVASGWGRTTPRGSSSTVLLETKINALNFTECLSIHQSFGATVTAKQICVRDDGSDGVTSTICQGDSGGPLMCGHDYKNVYGVASYTLDSCQGVLPAVYTSVAPYIKWIRSKSLESLENEIDD